MSDPFTGPMPLETRIDSILTEAFDGLAWDHSRDNVDMNSLLNTIEDVTPRILAAVADALTSDEALKAFVSAATWEEIYYADAEDGMTAALKAVGITKGGGNE